MLRHIASTNWSGGLPVMKTKIRDMMPAGRSLTHLRTIRKLRPVARLVAWAVAAAAFVQPAGGQTVLPSPETGPVMRVVPVAGTPAAVVALFPDGQVFYSPDGFNLDGTGSTVAAYSGNFRILDIVALSTGVDALLSDGSVFFSPDGMNL